METSKTLEEYRAEFCQHRFLATPLAGTIAWSVVGIASLWLNPLQSSMLLFAAVGGIVYLAPEHHFQAVPAVVVATYLVTIAALESRWRKLQKA